MAWMGIPQNINAAVPLLARNDSSLIGIFQPGIVKVGGAQSITLRALSTSRAERCSALGNLAAGPEERGFVCWNAGVNEIKRIAHGDVRDRRPGRAGYQVS